MKRLQQSAKNTKALQNMRTLLAAQVLYAGDNNNSFTPVYGDAPDGLTWGVRLFPYLGLTGRTFEDVAKDPTSVLNVPESMPANQRVAYGRSIAMNGYVRNTSNPSWNYRVAAVNQPSKVLLLVEIMERNAEYISVDTSGSKNGLGFRGDNGRRCRLDSAMVTPRRLPRRNCPTIKTQGKLFHREQVIHGASNKRTLMNVTFSEGGIIKVCKLNYRARS